MLDHEKRPVKDIPGLPLTLAGGSEGWPLEGLRRCTKIEVNEEVLPESGSLSLWDGIPWEKYPCWAKWLSPESTVTSERVPKTPAQYFKEFFDNQGLRGPPWSMGFQSGAIFAVTRETIQQYPGDMYNYLLEGLFLGDMKAVEPETGHYFERYVPAHRSGICTHWGEGYAEGVTLPAYSEASCDRCCSRKSVKQDVGRKWDRQLLWTAPWYHNAVLGAPLEPPMLSISGSKAIAERQPSTSSTCWLVYTGKAYPISEALYLPHVGAFEVYGTFAEVPKIMIP